MITRDFFTRDLAAPERENLHRRRAGLPALLPLAPRAHRREPRPAPADRSSRGRLVPLSARFAARGSLSAYYHSGMRDVFVVLPGRPPPSPRFSSPTRRSRRGSRTCSPRRRPGRRHRGRGLPDRPAGGGAGELSGDAASAQPGRGPDRRHPLRRRGDAHRAAGRPQRLLRDQGGEAAAPPPGTGLPPSGSGFTGMCRGHRVCMRQHAPGQQRSRARLPPPTPFLPLIGESVSVCASRSSGLSWLFKGVEREMLGDTAPEEATEEAADHAPEDARSDPRATALRQ